MAHPFAQTRVYFQTNDPNVIEVLADTLSQRLIQIGVPDFVLLYLAPHMASGIGIHVALAQYAPARLMEILAANDELEEGEDLDYFQGQIPDEDELMVALEDRVFSLLTETVIADDLDGVSSKELDEYLGSGRWTATKIVRFGVYDSNELSGRDILDELRRYF